MLVFVQLCNGILTIVCLNDAFQICARGFIRQGDGQDITLNVICCAHVYWNVNNLMFNDDFQIFAHGFIRQGHGQDIILNVSVCAHV